MESDSPYRETYVYICTMYKTFFWLWANPIILRKIGLGVYDIEGIHIRYVYITIILKNWTLDLGLWPEGGGQFFLLPVL